MYAVSFNTTSNTATAAFDQRIAGDGSNDQVVFLNANGDELGSPTNVVIPSFPNPGPVAITMDVDPAIMAQHPTQIALDPFDNNSPTSEGNVADGACAFYTALDAPNACSIPQVVSQTGSAARVKGIHLSKKVVSHKKSKKAHKAKKAHKKA
jgi:hypothetical protein